MMISLHYSPLFSSDQIALLFLVITYSNAGSSNLGGTCSSSLTTTNCSAVVPPATVQISERIDLISCSDPNGNLVINWSPFSFATYYLYCFGTTANGCELSGNGKDYGMDYPSL